MGQFVIATYRPKSGKEEALKAALQGHVDVLRAEGLATAHPVIRMAAADGTLLEIFEWAQEDAVSQAQGNQAVQEIWRTLELLCDHVPLKSLDEAAERFAHFNALEL